MAIDPDTEMLVPRVLSALRAWFTLDDDPGSRLDQLLLFQDRLSAMNGLCSPAALRRATNDLLITALERLGAVDPRGSQVLRARYLDLHTGKEVGSQLNLSLDQVNRLQALAIRRLTEIIVENERALWAQRRESIEASLPAQRYHQLFGVEDTITTLVRTATDLEQPPLLVVTGLGGLGKTALADAVARRLMLETRFHRILWITVKREGPRPAQNGMIFARLIDELGARLLASDHAGASHIERLAQIRTLLKARPHFIVVDNLEDVEEVGELIEQLPHLASPSRFLLTSRVRPAASSSTLIVTVAELDEEAADELVADHARQCGFGQTALPEHEDVDAIVNVVGGNPLALKMVIGLAAIQPLEDVLSEVLSCRPAIVERLYRHVFGGAWGALSPAAKAIVQAVPEADPLGMAPKELRVRSGVSEAAFWPAIQELTDRSLLDVRGTLRDKRYGVARLTYAFVHSTLADTLNPDSTGPSNG